MKLFPGLPTVLFLSLTESVSTKNQDVFPKSLRLDADEEHSVLLETVLEHGLNASQHLIEVQEEELYYKGAFVRKSEPAHFLSVFNKQKPQSKLLSKYAYASLHASGLLSRRSVHPVFSVFDLDIYNLSMKVPTNKGASSVWSRKSAAKKYFHI